MQNHLSNFWVLKAKGNASAFGGNEGYADEPESHYVFDTTVKNHDRIRESDFVVVVNKTEILGIGRINLIELIANVPKIRYRCPVCNIQEHYYRKNIEPHYKCRNKHTFDEPVEQPIVVEQFIAHYGDAFQKITNTSVKLLDDFYIKRNRYYSIQSADPSFLDRFNIAVNPTASSNRLNLLSKWAMPYIPNEEDTRKKVFVKRHQRNGQPGFRSDLFEIYGFRCMLTGINIPEAIEASHICPYRGKDDNHPRNGLLLRKDIHALFDSNLIGFNPTDLTLKIHDSLKGTLYEELETKKLQIELGDFSPSTEAMTLRWKEFLETIHDPKAPAPEFHARPFVQ